MARYEKLLILCTIKKPFIQMEEVSQDQVSISSCSQWLHSLSVWSHAGEDS